MKSIWKTVTAFGLALACLIPAFGCGSRPGRDKEKIDPNREQLYIGVYNGGVGTDWATELKRAFEAKYPKCQIFINRAKEKYNGETLSTGIAKGQETLYFTTEALYEMMVNDGKLEPITDAVTEPLDGETKSIEDKMDPALTSYFKRKAAGTDAPEYYGIPYFSAVYGIVYDRDLFVEKNLLGLEDYSSQNGPDGKTGVVDGYDYSADDGLPATWEDMKMLMRVMVDSGVTPFTWAGTGYEYYRRAFLRAMWASYEGYNDFMLNFTFDGVDNTLGRIDGTNAYLLQKQEGKKAAIQAAYDMVANPANYSVNAFNTTQSHLIAHSEFVGNKFYGGKPVAMMLEGGWWENETRDTFDEMCIQFPPEQVGYGKRNFGYMPMPRFVGTPGVADQTNLESTLYTDGNTMCFINSHADETSKEWAKQFIRFSTSDESLSAFTRMTGVIRPFDYDMSDADFNAMTPFSKSVWNAYKSPDARLTFTYDIATERFAKKNSFGEWDFGTIVGKSTGSDPLLEFSPYKQLQNPTVDNYFAGCAARFDESWWNSNILN